MNIKVLFSDKLLFKCRTRDVRIAQPVSRNGRLIIGPATLLAIFYEISDWYILVENWYCRTRVCVFLWVFWIRIF